MKIIKKTFSKNNNEIVLVEQFLRNAVGQVCPTYVYDKTILIIGVMHGDEPQGKFLIEKYLQTLCHCEEGTDWARRSNPKNKLLFIPCLNPDGMALNIRQNANKIDINRNFPTNNWIVEKDNPDYFGGNEAASEVETKFLVEVLDEFKPDVILTLHSPYKVVNYDGPAEKIADRISEIIGYSATTDIGYPTPGSFGTYAGVERNIPTITFELDEEIAVEELISPVHKIFDYLANF